LGVSSWTQRRPQKLYGSAERDEMIYGQVTRKHHQSFTESHLAIYFIRNRNERRLFSKHQEIINKKKAWARFYYHKHEHLVSFFTKNDCSYVESRSQDMIQINLNVQRPSLAKAWEISLSKRFKSRAHSTLDARNPLLLRIAFSRRTMLSSCIIRNAQSYP
jgi:hypothetical protein